MSQSSDANSRGKNRRKWSIMEEELALDFILELKGDPQWKCEGGFKAGFFKQLESMFEKKFPGIGLKASQIEAKVKFLKEKYSVIHEMTKLSEFSWDENTNMINCEKQAYLDFCKLHTRAKGLYQVAFPLFNKLDLIFGPDRATGDSIEDVEDMVNNMDNECIDLDTDEQLQDDYPRYSSPEAITRPPTSKRRKLGKIPLGLTRDNASEKFVIFI